MASLSADVATAVGLGRRERQEDAVTADFAEGSEVGLAVLSDGMGGHAAGHVASRIIVAEVFGELFFGASDIASFRASTRDMLLSAVAAANDSIRAHAESRPRRGDMGGTLLAAVVLDDRLYWASVGDSPMYLFRDGQLQRINDDHSMAPQIDRMVRDGLMDADAGRTHPDRSCLTSALTGRRIAHIDCPAEPIGLRPGDIVLLASDGLHSLPEHRIAGILDSGAHSGSRQLARDLLEEIERIDRPDQDNVSLAVIAFTGAGAAHRTAWHGGVAARRSQPIRQFLAQFARRSAL